MTESNHYTDDLRLIKSLLIVTSLQKRKDIQAINLIKKFSDNLTWKQISNLLIENECLEVCG